MNVLDIETLDGIVTLNIPENLHEITFGRLLELQKPELTNLETLSILTGMPVDDLYGVKSYEQVIKQATLYIDIFTESVKHADLNKLPKKLKLAYAGKTKVVKLGKVLSMEPAGAVMAARKIIQSEIAGHIDLYAEQWQEMFNPSFTASSRVVAHYLNRFFYKRYSEPEAEALVNDLVLHMTANDGLAMAKYLFNRYPNLYYEKRRNWLGKSINSLKVLPDYILLYLEKMRKLKVKVSFKNPA